MNEANNTEIILLFFINDANSRCKYSDISGIIKYSAPLLHALYSRSEFYCEAEGRDDAVKG